MTQKLLKVGGSTAVTIPKKSLEMWVEKFIAKHRSALEKLAKK